MGEPRNDWVVLVSYSTLGNKIPSELKVVIEECVPLIGSLETQSACFTLEMREKCLNYPASACVCACEGATLFPETRLSRARAVLQCRRLTFKAGPPCLSDFEFKILIEMKLTFHCLYHSQLSSPILHTGKASLFFSGMGIFTTLTVSRLHCRTARALLSLVSGKRGVPSRAGVPKPRRPRQIY